MYVPGYKEGKSKHLWVLDAGHGGLRDGYYTTCPNKMHVFPDGFTIYEGVINREITRRVWLQLVEHSIDFSLIHDEVDDDPLQIRTMRANKIYARDKRAVLVSIHSNAGGGQGNEVFVHPAAGKRTKAIAQVFCDRYMADFPMWRFRRHSKDQDYKTANFHMLRETQCPAILLESFFFDEREQAEYLASECGQQDIADCIVRAIMEIENSEI